MKLNVPRAAKILVDAEAMGDARAADKWKVDVRTIERYRARLQTDRDLSDAFAEKSREAERAWHLVRNRFLREVTEHLLTLCKTAKVDQISDVRQALKDVGELELAREALVGSGDHQPSPPPTGDARKPPAEEGGGGEGSGAEG